MFFFKSLYYYFFLSLNPKEVRVCVCVCARPDARVCTGVAEDEGASIDRLRLTENSEAKGEWAKTSRRSLTELLTGKSQRHFLAA